MEEIDTKNTRIKIRKKGNIKTVDHVQHGLSHIKLQAQVWPSPTHSPLTDYVPFQSLVHTFHLLNDRASIDGIDRQTLFNLRTSCPWRIHPFQLSNEARQGHGHGNDRDKIKVGRISQGDTFYEIEPEG